MLTNLEIKKASPKDKPYKLSDANGLFVLVNPNNSKYWRYKYFFEGKEKLISFGTYPETSLAEAREKRVEAAKLLRSGIDPSAARKQAKQITAPTINTFETIARRCIHDRAMRRAPGYEAYAIKLLERYIFPPLGNRDIAEIEPPQLLEVIRAIEAKGVFELSHRCKDLCSIIFRYAIPEGLCKRNPAADLKGALIIKPKQHRPAITKPDELAKLLSDIQSYDGHPVVGLALMFIAHTALRFKEAAFAQWPEFDFKNNLFIVPKERMKVKTADHVVPLTKQTFKLLEQLKQYNHSSPFVFALQTSEKPLSENTLLYALYRLGYKSRACVHGLRSAFSSILNTQRELGVHPFGAEIIEFQLAHLDNSIRASYNRSIYLQSRIALMQYWSDYLDTLIA